MTAKKKIEKIAAKEIKAAKGVKAKPVLLTMAELTRSLVFAGPCNEIVTFENKAFRGYFTAWFFRASKIEFEIDQEKFFVIKDKEDWVVIKIEDEEEDEV